MKRKSLYILLSIIVIICISIWCYNTLACHVIYELQDGEWIEIYRGTDSKRAYDKFEELLYNNPEHKMYFLMDEELGNSIIPN